MPATVLDIARRVGLSASTVADVLRGRPGYSEKTRQRIFDAAQQMQFVPNYFARSLMTKRSHTIGIEGPLNTVDVSGGMVKTIIDQLSARGYAALFLDAPGHPQRHEHVVAELRRRLVDGIIIRGDSDEPMLNRIVGSGCPIVAIRGHTTRACACVVGDRAGAFSQGVRWLAEQNHRRIAFVGVDHASTYGCRGNSHWGKIEGYLAAMKQLGLHDPDLLIDVPFGPGATRAFVAGNPKRFRGVTAVMAGNDELALEVISGLSDLGLSVPEDCSVMGFDNREFGAGFKPSLTTFDPHNARVGQLAVDMLLALIEGRSVTSQSVSPELVVRESVRALRTRGRNSRST